MRARELAVTVVALPQHRVQQQGAADQHRREQRDHRNDGAREPAEARIRDADRERSGDGPPEVANGRVRGYDPVATDARFSDGRAAGESGRYPRNVRAPP